jgi:hypothetical protein
MIKQKILPILASFAPILSVVAAEPLLKEDFQSYSAGEALPAVVGNSPGTWFFQPVRGGSGGVTIEKTDSGENFLAVREGISGSGMGSWLLYRLLEQSPATGEPVSLEVRFRMKADSAPSDWIFGPIDLEFPRIPGNNNFLSTFRVRNNPTSGQVEFRYWRPDLKAGEGGYSAAVNLESGVWYRLTAVIQPAESTMSLRLSQPDGTPVLEESGISLKSPVGEIGGVAFKNRVSDLNTAEFDLAEVTLKVGNAISE